VVGVFAETHAARPPSPPALGGYLLALAAAAMLSGRRRAPVVAAVGVVAVCLAYHLLGYPGLAPAVALYCKSLGHEDWFYYYLSGMICLSLIIYSTMRDTKHESAMHRHQ